MKSSSAPTIPQNSLVSVCCTAGFTKTVQPGPHYDRAAYWKPVQICAACKKDCEVVLYTPPKK